MRYLILIGMIAIGVLVWKLLQRQEKRSGEGGGSEENEEDRFGW